MSNDAKELLGLVGFFVGLFVVLIALIYGGQAYACNKAGRLMSKPTHYLFAVGCMVEVNGVTVPLDAYRVVEKR